MVYCSISRGQATTTEPGPTTSEPVPRHSPLRTCTSPAAPVVPAAPIVQAAPAVPVVPISPAAPVVCFLGDGGMVQAGPHLFGKKHTPSSNPPGAPTRMNMDMEMGTDTGVTRDVNAEAMCCRHEHGHGTHMCSQEDGQCLSHDVNNILVGQLRHTVWIVFASQVEVLDFQLLHHALHFGMQVCVLNRQ